MREADTRRARGTNGTNETTGPGDARSRHEEPMGTNGTNETSGGPGDARSPAAREAARVLRCFPWFPCPPALPERPSSAHAFASALASTVFPMRDSPTTTTVCVAMHRDRTFTRGACCFLPVATLTRKQSAWSRFTKSHGKIRSRLSAASVTTICSAVSRSRMSSLRPAMSALCRSRNSSAAVISSLRCRFSLRSMSTARHCGGVSDV
mmetsp:Transcript_35142/g.109405  ORF Transcript_35142/g.109405 Transcript_35142/m.109405 type:complete len:208 (+) Transcript_35142:362-985(+)